MKKSEKQLIREAAEWRTISLLFDCPSNEWFTHVRDMGRQIDDPILKKAARAAQREASEVLFHSIFGPGGPPPGREISYRGWVQPGYMLSELSSFHDAFQYKRVTDEAPDHVSVETGFISYLRLKEAFANECKDVENAKITADASRTFIAEHLSKYSEQISKILSNSGIQYLSLAGKALFNRVGVDKDKLNQTYLPVLENEDDETPYACGLA